MAPVIFEAIDRDRDFLRKWLPFVDDTREVSDTEKFLRQVDRDSENGTAEIFSVWYREEFAGLIGFNTIDRINRKAEIGYWLVEKMQGKGIITTSASLLIRYGFNQLKINRIQIKTAVGNQKSAAIPMRLGFVFEGIERSGERHHNQYFDLRVYSRLKSDKKVIQ